MWSLSLVMSECSLSGRGQSHVSNFYIVDLENFATASRRYTGDIHESSVVGLFMTHLRQWKLLGRVMVECTLSITHCLRLNLQLRTIDTVRTSRISSFCTAAWQLARFQLTRRIARSLGDSWASCRLLLLIPSWQAQLDLHMYTQVNGQLTNEQSVKIRNISIKFNDFWQHINYIKRQVMLAMPSWCY